MEKQYDIVALGESLIDFTPAGTNETGMRLFSRNPGGAPANVLAMYARLGGAAAFIGKVGDDEFGRFLIKTMADAGIDTCGVKKDRAVPTTLAFVHLDEIGDRSFTFYRKPGADIMLAKNEVPAALVEGCRMFHFGSVSLTDEPCRTATLAAAKAARAAGAVVSYDPNYRPFLWPDTERAKQELSAAVPLADLLKVSGEEMTLLTGETDLASGAAKLAGLGPAAVAVTLGRKGAFLYTRDTGELVSAYDVKTVDTTGAGDAFWGAFLWRLKGKDLSSIDALTGEQWRDIVRFANAAGSLTTASRGAIPAMPDGSAVAECMRNAETTA